jgi:hypothetical protein
MDITFLILFLVLIFIIYLITIKKDINEGFLYTFNGRAAIDDQYFYDKLFDDVVYYQNDYDPNTGDLVKTGWEKCILSGGPGKCVEYGITGATYKFNY